MTHEPADSPRGDSGQQNEAITEHQMFWGKRSLGGDHKIVFDPPVEMQSIHLDSSGKMLVVEGRSEDEADVVRYVLPKSTARALENGGKSVEIELVPLLADRSVVTRPSVPLTLTAHSEIKIHFTTPLWMGIDLVDPRLRIAECAIQRPSDTWFGPDTTEGDLCYAALSYGSVLLDGLPNSPLKAATSVIIRNESKSELPVERVLVPVLNLSLYLAEDGRLWTDDVILEREGEDNLAHLVTHTADSSTSPWTRTAKLVARPRVVPRKGAMIRAFSTLLGGWEQ